MSDCKEKQRNPLNLKSCQHPFSPDWFNTTYMWLGDKLNQQEIRVPWRTVWCIISFCLRLNYMYTLYLIWISSAHFRVKIKIVAEYKLLYKNHQTCEGNFKYYAMPFLLTSALQDIKNPNFYLTPWQKKLTSASSVWIFVWNGLDLF